MIRYKEKAKDCQLIVKVRLPFGQSVSDNDLEFFARKCLRGFLRPKRVRSNTLEYVGPIAVPLYDRLKKPIRKYDFFFLIEQIVDATQKLQKNALPWNKVVWDLRHAYINETTKEVQLIYSKNKTFINGQAIPAQYECEIFDGNRLTLGNEEFIFNT